MKDLRERETGGLQMAWVIRDERELKRPDGTTFKHVSFFRGEMFGMFNEFCKNPEDAKKYRTRALAENSIRNRFRGRKNYSPERFQ